MTETLSSSPEQKDNVDVKFELPSEYQQVCSVEASPQDSEGFVRPMYQLEGSPDKYIFVSPHRDVELAGDGETFHKVYASPEGLLGQAIKIRPEDPKLSQLLENIKEQTYTEEETGLLDDIAAAVAVDSEGKISALNQTEGFALVLVALTGNQKARELIDAKRHTYYEYAKQKQAERARQSSREAEPGQSLSWNQVAFVHSTSHNLLRDKDGNLELRPYSYHHAGTETAWPRSTIHFTVNSEVESHMEGHWSASNRMIVYGGQAFVDSNGYPANMNVIDTYWSVSPGQWLELRGASVVEPTPDLEEIFIEDPDNKVVRYRDKPEYTAEERKEIYKLQRVDEVKKYHDQQDWDYYLSQIDLESKLAEEAIDALAGNEQTVLRKLALDAAMKQQGVSTGPIRLGQWSSGNPEFDAGYSALSAELSIPYGIHFGSYEHMIESRGDIKEADELNQYSSFQIGHLAAQRTVVANGFIATAKVSAKAEPAINL